MSIKISLSVKIYYSTFIFPPVYIRSFINDRVQQFVNYGAPINTLRGVFLISVRKQTAMTPIASRIKHIAVFTGTIIIFPLLAIWGLWLLYSKTIKEYSRFSSLSANWQSGSLPRSSLPIRHLWRLRPFGLMPMTKK